MFGWLTQALKLIAFHPSQHRLAAIVLLPLLPVIPVKYDKKLVKAACCSIAEACGQADPLGTAVSLLSESFFSDDEKLSWGECKDKVRKRSTAFLCIK